ncbi:hypothetical protein Glove_309g170 [Diversispora epigaea]|uniref:Uncharacterized protein n=1 Tax=Diversispora epigaea TaxID=1348612 RepID=A0A397HZU4_9GLOM|nr:hypothetical protein Glove_309g170 [Diversispora epigaea]
MFHGKKNLTVIPQSLSLTLSPSTLVLKSPKRRSFNLRHHVSKFKINCVKYYGDKNQIVKYCIQYFNDFPSSYSTLYNRAETFGKLKRYEEALNDLNYAIANLWKLNLDRGEFQDAINDLNKALKFQPDNALALRNRCKYYKILMDAKNVLNDLNKLCILEPENDYQHELRRAILLNMRKWNDSLKNLNLVIKTLSNNVAPINNKAKLYCKQGRNEFLIKKLYI